MMRPFELPEILFETENLPCPKLIKKPKKKKNHKAWYAYFDWWLKQQYTEIWVTMNECQFPYKRN